MDYSIKFINAVGYVLEHEGGLIDGQDEVETIKNFGISLKLYRMEINKKATSDDIRNLTRENAMKIYFHLCWEWELEKITSQNIIDRVLDSIVCFGFYPTVQILMRSIWSVTGNPNFMAQQDKLDENLIYQINYLSTHLLCALRSERASYCRVLIEKNKNLMDKLSIPLDKILIRSYR